MSYGHRAVVLGANYYIGLSVIRCLGRENVPVTVVDYEKDGAYALSSKYIDETLIGPHYKTQPETCKDYLIDYAKKLEYKPVLYPTSDPYVEFVDEYLDELSKYYLITMTEKGLWSQVLNKSALYEMAQEHGMRIPKTIQTNEKNLIEKVESKLGYPCLVKPTDSPKFVDIFRKKLFEVNNRDELKDSLKKVRQANIEVVVQELIQGFDDNMYTFDAYFNQESKVTHWMTANKFRQYPINFGASVFIQQKYVPELAEIGIPFMETIGYKGFGEIEFKKDAETGEYYLIEINARMTNFNQMIADVGLNMPFITYQELTGQPIGSRSIQENNGLAFHYMFDDFFASRVYIKAGQLTRREILKSYRMKKTGAIWAIDDPKPGLKFVWNNIIKRIFNKVFKGN